MADLVELMRPLVANYELFAERCLHIRTKSGELKPLIFNAAQKHVHGAIEHQRTRTGMVRALVVKGRQQGISTYVEGRFFHRTSTHRGQRAFILTHLAEATDNLFGITKRYQEHCPYPYQREVMALSATELRFRALDSEFSVATAKSKGTGRSATAQLFHGSEVAFWDNAYEHMAGIGQIVPDAPGTEIILESTGNGEGNLFHGMVLDAMRGVGRYILVFVPWFWQTEYRLPVPDGFVLDAEEAEYAERYRLDTQQMAWRRDKIQTDCRSDVSLFDQEYPAEPLFAFRRQAEESYIPAALVARARRTQVAPSEHAPKIMGLDPAEYGEDTTVLFKRQGRKTWPYERWSQKSPMEVVGLTARRADGWKPDMINVDATGIGSGIADRLLELGYPANRVIVGERAVEAEQYVLVRDEIWGETKKWLEDAPCELPDDDSLQADLTGPTYTYDSSRRLKIESKEHMKSRGLKSPDAGDALGLTLAVPTGDWARREKLDHGRRVNWRVP